MATNKPKKKLSQKGYTYTLHTTIERLIHNKKGFLVEDEDNICRNCLGTGKTNRRFMSWSSKEYKSLKELQNDADSKYYGFDVSVLNKRRANAKKKND